MARCRCQKKMRMRGDGWKRCHKCGAEVMGLALRAKIGAALHPAVPASIAPAAIATPRRLPVTWTSAVPA